MCIRNWWRGADKVAKQWADVIAEAFKGGTYNHEHYVSSYHEILGMKPNGGRLIDFMNFYPISLLQDGLDAQTECVFMDYVLNKDNGIYYIYDKKISVVPQDFESRIASRYLAAIELLAKYKHVKHKLYFPLSDDWRRQETREADCTERIEKLLRELV